jgi:hypothetical protein
MFHQVKSVISLWTTKLECLSFDSLAALNFSLCHPDSVHRDRFYSLKRDSLDLLLNLVNLFQLTLHEFFQASNDFRSVYFYLQVII